MSDDKIADIDKRLAVVEQQMNSMERAFERAISKMEAAQSRLFWLVAAGLVGALMNFIVKGGLNIAV